MRGGGPAGQPPFKSLPLEPEPTLPIVGVQGGRGGAGGGGCPLSRPPLAVHKEPEPRRQEKKAGE